MSTIFSQIIEGKLPCTKVFESENILVIEDLHPVAPIHLLIIPKKSLKNLQSIEKSSLFILQEVVQVAQKLAREKGIEDGYRLLTNNGIDAGQTIFHLHFHLIGGRKLGSMA